MIDLLDRIAVLEAAAAHTIRPTRRTDVDPNRLTQKSQEALHDAQTKALRFGHTEVDGEHLLLALLDQPDGLVPRLLEPGRRRPRRGCGHELEAELAAGHASAGPGAAPGQVFVTQRLSRLLDTAEREAKRLKDEYVSVEHLVIALLEEGSETAAGRLLQRAGPDPGRVPAGADRDPGQPAGDLGHAGGRLRGAGEVRPGPRRRRPRRASSTRSSGATPRSAGSSRSCPARPRTTRC